MVKGHSKLPGLNGLRALAASFVLFSHVYQISGDYGDNWAADLFRSHSLLGVNMVNLFFVISGFIITHILFLEREKTGSISLRKFYFNRILRIWPLYFGIFFIVLVIGATSNLYENYPSLNATSVVLLILFLVNFSSLTSASGFSVLPHYWSLSIEEQFYIFWPVFFKHLKGLRSLFFPVCVLFGIIGARALVVILYRINPSQQLTNVLEILSISKFGSISLGVISSWLLYYKHPFLKVVFSPIAQVLSWAVLLLTIFSNYKIPYIHFEVTAFFYSIIVLNVTSNSSPLFTLESKFLDLTGKISYGLYMYHWPLLPALIYLFKKMGIWSTFVAFHQLPLLFITYFLTWGLAYISYKYYEAYFQRMRLNGN